jgi:hypothetical protein
MRELSGLLMLEYPPREGFFRRKCCNLERNAQLAVVGEAYFVCPLFVDATPIT